MKQSWAPTTWTRITLPGLDREGGVHETVLDHSNP